MKPFLLLGNLPISDLSPEEVCLLAGRRKRGVTLWLMADAPLFLRCKRQESVLSACLLADRVFAEGEEIRVAAARMGKPMQSKAFTAFDLVPALMAAEEGRYFFLGGERGMARRAAVAAAQRAKRVPCPAVGGVSGNFCRKGRENTAVLTRLWECQPDVVLVCLDDGMLWLAENREKLPPALYLSAPSYVMEALARGTGARQQRAPKEQFDYLRTRYAFYRLVKRQS